MPIAFYGAPLKALGTMLLFQVSFKILYEIAILPVTSAVVRKVKESEGVDVFDRDISYNPFKLTDI